MTTPGWTACRCGALARMAPHAASRLKRVRRPPIWLRIVKPPGQIFFGWTVPDQNLDQRPFLNASELAARPIEFGRLRESRRPIRKRGAYVSLRLAPNLLPAGNARSHPAGRGWPGPTLAERQLYPRKSRRAPRHGGC